MSVFRKDLLTVRDVAWRFSIGVRTVWRWVALGKLPPPMRLSARCVRWRDDDLQRYVAGLRPKSEERAG
jgi:predicted DNA-binding transcriptional regulator AlpA